jgi:hypothetical protein
MRASLTVFTATPFEHRLRLRLTDKLRERRNLITSHRVPNVALWRLSVADILSSLNTGEDVTRLLLPLEAYHQKDATPSTDILHALAPDQTPIGDPVTDNDCGGNGSWSSNEGSSVDTDDDEDRIDADIMTELSTGFQRVSVRELPSMNVQLPSVTESTHVSSPRSMWRDNHPMPTSLPPISTLFEVLDADHSAAAGIGLPDPHHRVWTVAASAFASDEAPHVRTSILLSINSTTDLDIC